MTPKRRPLTRAEWCRDFDSHTLYCGCVVGQTGTQRGMQLAKTMHIMHIVVIYVWVHT